MKKLLLFAICILVFRAHLQAQQYYPMLDSVNVWHYILNQFPVTAPSHPQVIPDNSCGYPNFSAFAEMNTSGDTSINSIIYKQVMAGDGISFSCLYGFIREDTASRKIYFKDTDGSPESVLYDFSMQVGNRISLSFYLDYIGSSYFTNGSYRLDSISNRMIKAGLRRTFYLNCDTCTASHTLEWIESVGNTGDAIYTYSANYLGDNVLGCPDFPHDFIQTMICFDHDQIVYYDSCMYQAAVQNTCFNVLDTCDYYNTCGLVNEISSLSDIQISPNPSDGNATVRLDVKNPVNIDLIVWDMTGKNLLNKISLGRLEKGLKNKQLNLSAFNNGFYLLEFRTQDGSLFKKLIIEK
jgi:hypothetical protein